MEKNHSRFLELLTVLSEEDFSSLHLNTVINGACKFPFTFSQSNELKQTICSVSTKTTFGGKIILNEKN